MSSPQTAETPSRPPASFRHLIWAALFMLVGLSFLIFLGRERGRIVGQPLIDLDLQPLLHVDQELKRDSLKGKVVVLHFWGPWCGPCRTEYPEIARLQKAFNEHPDVRVVSVSCAATFPENLAELRSESQQLLGPEGEGLAVYCDPAEFSRVQVAKLLSQRGFAYPTTLLLDRQGRVVDFWLGATAAGEIERALSKELAKSGTGT